MEKVNRNHFSTIIYNTISNMITIFFPMLLIAFSKDKKKEIFINTKVKLVIILVLFMICLIYQAVKWYKNIYSIRENMIFIQSGVFFVKRKEIPFEKIQTVNFVDGIGYRIFNIVKLKIDTGNSSSSESELKIVINKKTAEVLKNNILKLKENEIKSNEVKDKKEDFKTEESKEVISEFKISNKEMLISSVVTSSIFAGVAFVLSIFAFFDDYLKGLFNVKIKKVYNLKNIDIKHFSLSYIIIGTLLLIVLYFIFTIIVSFITNYIKYYRFSVKREENNIIINYGFFERKNYIIPVKKISAVYFKQNMLAQILSISPIHIEIVGYGDEKGEEAVIYPVADCEKQREIIIKLLPEFCFQEKLVKAPEKTFLRFIISHIRIPFVISIILTIKFKHGYISLIALLGFILSGIMEYRNTGIGNSDKLICLTNESFTKITTIIPKNKIQSIAFKSNYFQDRIRVKNFIVSIQGNSFGKAIGVRNMGCELIQNYEKDILG